MKKTINAVLTLIIITSIIILPITALAAGSGILSFDISDNDIWGKEEYTLTFDISNASNVSGISIDMKYDPDIFKINLVSLNYAMFGDLAEDVQLVYENLDNDTGTVEYCWIIIGGDSGADITTEINAITVECQGAAAEDTSFTYSITNESATALSLDGDNIRILLSDSNAAPITLNTSTQTVSFSCGFTDEVVSGELQRTYTDEEGSITCVEHYMGDTAESGLATKDYYNGDKLFFTEEYNEDEKVIASIFYYDDEVTRKQKAYYRTTGDCTLYFVEEYDTNGDMVASTFYREDGTTRQQKAYYRTTGDCLLYFVEEYDDNGILIASTFYREDGTTRQQKAYYRTTGDCTLYFVEEYNESGILIASTFYREDGTTRQQKAYYREDGSLYFVEEYNESGILIASTFYREDGTTRQQKAYYTTEGVLYLVEECNESGATIITNDYYEDGETIYRKCFFTDEGELTKIEYYDTKGELIETVYY